MAVTSQAFLLTVGLSCTGKRAILQSQPGCTTIPAGRTGGPTIGTKEHLPSRNTFLLLISTRIEEKELSIRAENKAEYYHLYYPLFE